MAEFETIELPGAFTLKGADTKDTRLITVDDEGITYTRIDGLNPRTMGLLVFSNEPAARELISKFKGTPGGVRITEHFEGGRPKVISTYAEIQNPDNIYLHTVDGVTPRNFKVHLQPEIGDFAFGTTRVNPNKNDLIGEHNYALLEVTDIDLAKTKAVVRIGRTLN